MVLGESSERGTLAKYMWTTVSAMAILAAKKTGSLTRKFSLSKGKRRPRRQSNTRVVPRSPRLALAKPKQLLNTVSSKAITFVHNHVINKKLQDDEKVRDGGHREWGDGGLWQRRILLGEKCQPLDFSGVIYYDDDGNQLEEVPIRSPHASPMPGYLARRSC